MPFDYNLVSESNHSVTSRVANSFPQNANLKVSESISVNDFGARGWYPQAYSYLNTAAIVNAVAAATLLGKSVRFPDPVYFVDKFNLLTYNVTSNQTPPALWSDCSEPGSNGRGTRLICTGTGASWLKGVVNVAAPNVGNTGINTSIQIHGVRIKGIWCEQINGIGGGTLDGFWLNRCWDLDLEDCGATAPPGIGYWRSGCETWSCTAGRIRRFTAFNGSTGIALNGGTLDTEADFTYGMYLEDCDLENCTAAGISTQFAQFCKIHRCFLVANAVGVYFNGKEGTVSGSFFSGNTIDVDMLTATAPWAGTPSSKPDQLYLVDNTFTAAVNIRNSVGTTLLDNKFDAGSSLLIDANCTNTVLFQHNSFPGGAFSDLGVNTYLVSSQLVTAAPTAATPGVKNQLIFNKTTGILYICITSGMAGSSAWQAVGGAGGGGVTSLNALTGALSITAGSGISVAAAGSSVQVTNTSPGTTPGAASNYSPSWADFAGVATITPGTVKAAYVTFGKWCYIRIAAASVAVSGANCNVIKISLPVTAFNDGSSIMHAPAFSLQSVSSGFAIAGLIIVDGTGVQFQIAGPSAFLNGSSYGVFIEGVYETT